jgi:uncharacterized oligopeptide transporter (OPT) family protein
VAIAVTDPNFSIPASSKMFGIYFSIFGAFMVLLRQLVWTGKREWMRQYHPSMMVISLAFLLPSSVYGTAMLIGAGSAWIWSKKSPRSFEMFRYAVSAGFMAGEGIGGVINAALTILGVDGDTFGSQVLCPGGRC